MKVRYTGPSGSGVDVIHPDPEAPDTNTVTHCPPGEEVDLPDDIAVSSMVTGMFEPADPKAERALAKRRRQDAAEDDADEPAVDESTDQPAEPDTQEA